MAKQKKVTITGFFPELASSHAYQTARGSGGTMVVAVSRALRELCKLPHVKGHRVTTVTLTVVVE
jgi:hypothetical protein